VDWCTDAIPQTCPSFLNKENKLKKLKADFQTSKATMHAAGQPKIKLFALLWQCDQFQIKLSVKVSHGFGNDENELPGALSPWG